MFLDLGFLGFFSTDTEKKKKSLEKHALLKRNFLQKKKSYISPVNGFKNTSYEKLPPKLSY